MRSDRQTDRRAHQNTSLPLPSTLEVRVEQLSQDLRVCMSMLCVLQACRGYGDPHGDPHGYGYGVGMGIEIPSPRQPWRSDIDD